MGSREGERGLSPSFVILSNFLRARVKSVIISIRITFVAPILHAFVGLGGAADE